MRAFAIGPGEPLHLVWTGQRRGRFAFHAIDVVTGASWVRSTGDGVTVTASSRGA